jgi:gamma-glutamylcyclotransferase (GGCT)/AIG2-like uncharacterized protein YtfP
MADPDFVFVYGSLMRGLELHHHMKSGEYVCDATARGTLVSLGAYPGLIDGPDTVRGEVYRFADLPAALDVLDDVEDFDATDPDASLYVRVSREVTTTDGRAVNAWLYVYNRTTKGARKVEGGDWRAPARN